MAGFGESFRDPSNGRCSWMPQMPLLSLRFGTQCLRRIRDHLCGSQAWPNASERCSNALLVSSCVISFLVSICFNMFQCSWYLVHLVRGKACDILLPVTVLCPVGPESANSKRHIFDMASGLFAFDDWLGSWIHQD